MIVYAIRQISTKRLMEWTTTSNGDAEFCVSTSFEIEPSLDEFPERLWMTLDRATALKILEGPIPWYNASYDSPQYNKKLFGDLEVVEFQITYNQEKS